jgi:hypothetical protein
MSAQRGQSTTAPAVAGLPNQGYRTGLDSCVPPARTGPPAPAARTCAPPPGRVWTASPAPWAARIPAASSASGSTAAGLLVCGQQVHRPLHVRRAGPRPQPCGPAQAQLQGRIGQAAVLASAMWSGAIPGPPSAANDVPQQSSTHCGSSSGSDGKRSGNCSRHWSSHSFCRWRIMRAISASPIPLKLNF